MASRGRPDMCLPESLIAQAGCLRRSIPRQIMPDLEEGKTAWFGIS